MHSRRNPLTLIQQDEFTGLFAKMRQDGGSSLLQTLNTLYDCPPMLEVNTKNNPIRVENPYGSFFSGAPPESLKDMLQPHHFTSGLLNRFSFYTGTDKAPIPIPKRADLKHIRNRVNGIQQSEAGQGVQDGRPCPGYVRGVVPWVQEQPTGERTHRQPLHEVADQDNEDCSHLRSDRAEPVS